MIMPSSAALLCCTCSCCVLLADMCFGSPMHLKLCCLHKHHTPAHSKYSGQSARASFDQL
jgi:hypothetical protein